MDIIKFSTDWARAEVFSSRFFIIAGILFIAASIGFWQLGKTEIARAYIIPNLVAGGLLLAIGLGIFFTNKSRVTSFVDAYEKDPKAFVVSEIARTEKSMNEYKNIVFKIIPLIIIICALLLLFMNKPNWRASMITVIAMMAVIMIIDSNANGRLETYRAELEKVQGH